MAQRITVRPSLVDTVVLWLDPSGRIELASGALQQVLGVREERLLAYPIWYWWEELTETGYRVWWQAVRADERPFREIHFSPGPQRNGVPLVLRTRFIERGGQQFVRCELEPPAAVLAAESLPQWGLRSSRGGAVQWKITTGELVSTPGLGTLLGRSDLPDGYAPKSFLGLLRPVCDAAALELVKEMVRRIQQSGRPEALHVAARLPDRPHARLRIYGEPLRQEGSITALRLCIQDISDIEGDNRSADRFLQLLMQLSVPVWQIDAAGAVKADNLAARALLGAAAATEPVYADVRNLEIDVLSEGWESWSQRAAAASNPVAFAGVLRRVDGSVLPIALELHHFVELTSAPYLLVAAPYDRERAGAVGYPDAGTAPTAAESPWPMPLQESELGVQIVYRSETYERVMRQVRQVGPTDSTVIIYGETGTGKELLARAVHEYSRRRSQVLVKINCAVLPETLAESELFGHEKGAFTGAYAQQIGKFEQADGGTIFLDEVGELSLAVQAKLLRVLQEGEIERVGGKGVRRVDVRVVAATNRDLRAEVDAGKFRGDLYFRLNVFPIYNPPLRDRPEDILPLAEHLLRKHAQRLNRGVNRIGKRAAARLRKYTFPGNVRELENIIERGIILATTDVLRLEHWVQEAPLTTESDRVPSFEEGQRILIERALRASRGRVSGAGGAAELLRLNPQTLYSKMRKLGIERGDY